MLLLLVFVRSLILALLLGSCQALPLLSSFEPLRYVLVSRGLREQRTCPGSLDRAEDLHSVPMGLVVLLVGSCSMMSWTVRGACCVCLDSMDPVSPVPKDLSGVPTLPLMLMLIAGGRVRPLVLAVRRHVILLLMWLKVVRRQQMI